jgi:1,4-alpha-glucan branching enzyme
VDEFLREHGLEYFFVDSHMIRGGEPLGTYWQKFPQLAEMFARTRHLFTPPTEFRSEYEHYAIPGGTTIFARDPETTVKVWSGDVGYPGDEWYLEFHKQLYPGRLRYWRISPEKADLGAKKPYDPWVAYDNVHAHAKDLVQLVKATLARYRGQANRDGTVVAMYDTELFGHWWWEGPEFLYEFVLELAKDGEVDMCSGGDVVDQDPAQHVINLPEGSWGEGGYHSVWLNDDNFWTWQRLYPAERRFLDMVETMSSGPAKEIVEQCGRELLLAESSDWQFLISTFSARDYAEARFTDHLDRFDRLADLAEKVNRDEAMSPDDSRFLRECQEKDAPFPDLDLSIWRRKVLSEGSWH